MIKSSSFETLFLFFLTHILTWSRREEKTALSHYLLSDKLSLDLSIDLFIITHFLRHLHSFSIHLSKNDDSESYSFNIILHKQEIITACQLLHNHRELHSVMISCKYSIDLNSSEWHSCVAAHDINMSLWADFRCKLLSYCFAYSAHFALSS